MAALQALQTTADELAPKLQALTTASASAAAAVTASAAAPPGAGGVQALAPAPAQPQVCLCVCKRESLCVCVRERAPWSRRLINPNPKLSTLNPTSQTLDPKP